MSDRQQAAGNRQPDFIIERKARLRVGNRSANEKARAADAMKSTRRDSSAGANAAPEAQGKSLMRAAAAAALGAAKVREVERLRAKNWSDKGIARFLLIDIALVRALLGIEGGVL